MKIFGNRGFSEVIEPIRFTGNAYESQRVKSMRLLLTDVTHFSGLWEQKKDHSHQQGSLFCVISLNKGELCATPMLIKPVHS